jgi:hypothetical protein
MFAGGGGSRTIYQPNPRAKYEADMAMFQRADENARLAEEILRGQTQTQTGFSKYQFDMQNQLIDQETQMALNNLESQYNMGVFQQSMKRMANEADRYTQLINLQQQRQQAQFDYDQTMQRLGIRRDETDIAETSVGLERAGANAGYNMARNQTDIARQQLAQGAENDKFALQQAKKELTLKQAGLVDARTNVNYQEQGIDLAKIQSDAAFSQELQALGTKESEGNVQAQIAKANAAETRKEALRQLSLELTGNERDAQNFYSQLVGGSGFSDASGSINQIQAQMVDNERTRASNTSIMERYGMNMAQSDLMNDLNKNQVSQSRRNTLNNKTISDANLGLQRGQLDVARSGLNQQAQGIDIQRENMDAQFQQAQAARELQARQLAAQQQYDILSKSLLPNAQADLALQNLQNQRNSMNLDSQQASQGFMQGMQGLEAAQQGFNVQQGIQEQQLGLADDSLLPVFQNQQQQIGAQRNMNDASNWANYIQQQGATQQQYGAGLSQIAAQQHGLLSQLGGYQNPAPVDTGGGGGINWGGIGQFGQSLMGLLGNMGGGAASGGGYEPQLMGAYSPSPSYVAPRQSAPYSNPYAGQMPIAPPMPHRTQPIAPPMGRKPTPWNTQYNYMN